MGKRGRPKLTHIEDQPRKYQVEFNHDEGIKVIWKYDLDFFPNGPISVDIIYPKDFKQKVDDFEVKNSKLPKTKQKYFNPTNGKYVGYTRAKNLKLI